ncbi:hypothetical protein ACFL54_08230, partial [Planctomycetota bacterium]
MRTLKVICLVICLAVYIGIGGCGGGGGRSSHSGSAVNTIIEGVVHKGALGTGHIIIYKPNAAGFRLTEIKRTTTDNFGHFKANLGLYNGPIILHAISGSYPDEANGGQWWLENFVEEVDSDGFITTESLGCVVPHVENGTNMVAITMLTDISEILSLVLEMNNIEYDLAIRMANDMVSEYFGFDIVKTQPRRVTDLDGPIPYDVRSRYALIQVGLCSIYGTLTWQIDNALDQEIPTTNHTMVMNLLSWDILDGDLDMGGCVINPDDDPDEQYLFTAIPVDPEEDPLVTFWPSMENYGSTDLVAHMQAWINGAANRTGWTDAMVQ